MSKVLTGVFVLAGLVAVTTLTPQPVSAVDVDPCKNTVNTGSALCNDKTDANGVIKIIINTLLFLVGGVAVVVIIIAGLRYTTSGGNANGVSAAKNMLLYAVIGLVVAIFAFAIVNWVVFRATNT